MEYLQLGELKVSRMAFGTWHLGGDWGEVDESQAVRAISHARDLGVNLFDTAQAYGFGQAESILGRILFKKLRESKDEIVIASKGGIRSTPTGVVRDSSRGWLREGIESSLRALGVETIDIYHVHWPDENIPIAEVAGTMGELVDEGKARYVGVSNYDETQVADFARVMTPHTLQVPYSFIRRGAEEKLLPLATREGITVLAYSPLAHGILSGSVTNSSVYADDDWRSSHGLFQGEQLARQLEAVEGLRTIGNRYGMNVARLAYGWVLANPGVDVVIMGTLRERNLDEAISCVDFALPVEILHEMNATYRKWVADTGQ